MHNYAPALYVMPKLYFHLGIIIRVETVLYKGIILNAEAYKYFAWYACVHVQ